MLKLESIFTVKFTRIYIYIYTHSILYIYECNDLIEFDRNLMQIIKEEYFW